MFDTARVRVHYNLRKRCLSVIGMPRGLVVAHTDRIVLDDAKFIIQPAGQKRVREQGRKNVHAFVEGFIAPDQSVSSVGLSAVTYNPYKFDTFVDTAEHLPVHTAELAIIKGKRVWVDNTCYRCGLGCAWPDRLCQICQLEDRKAGESKTMLFDAV